MTMHCGAGDRTNLEPARPQVAEGGRPIENGAEAAQQIEHIDADLLFRDLQDWDLFLKAEPSLTHKLLSFEEEERQDERERSKASATNVTDNPSFKSVRRPKP